MSNNDEQISYFAKYDYRGKEQPFGIKNKDRSKHLYVIGKTGMGKSTLLENLAAQDIKNGNGVGFIDPHGGSAELLLDYVPKERVKDVIYFAPFDMDYPVSFNVMEDVGYDKRHLVVSGLMSAFKKIWVDAWSARMEYILTNTILALLEYPDSTILSINRMLVDKDYRKTVVANVTDPIVKSFWVDEFAKYTDRYTQEATPAIQNKVGQFVSNPLIRNILGQPKSTFDFRKVMDEKKILIINLSKGRMGDVNSKLLGAMLVTKVYLAAMSRADLPKHEIAKLPDFYFFVDEFQSFANESFADILSEARKYKLALTIAHQYVGQMEDEVRDAIFGNVGTLITFRIGAEDAEMFEKEFAPVFITDDLVNLGAYQVYLKLMIDGLASKPFSAKTLPPLELPAVSYREEIIENSRKIFAGRRAEIEENIKKWQEPIFVEKGLGDGARERGFERGSERDLGGVGGRESRWKFNDESRDRRPSPASSARGRDYPPRDREPYGVPRERDERRDDYRESHDRGGFAPRPYAPASVFAPPAPLSPAPRPQVAVPPPPVPSPSVSRVVSPGEEARPPREAPRAEQPFKKAFEEVRRDPRDSRPSAPQREQKEQPLGTIPLKFLKTGGGNDPRAPHLADLRAALADAIKNEKKSAPMPTTAPASAPVVAPATAPVTESQMVTEAQQAPIPPKSIPAPESVKTPEPVKTPPPPTVPKEIPEVELRKLLSLDD